MYCTGSCILAPSPNLSRKNKRILLRTLAQASEPCRDLKLQRPRGPGRTGARHVYQGLGRGFFFFLSPLFHLPVGVRKAKLAEALDWGQYPKGNIHIPIIQLVYTLMAPSQQQPYRSQHPDLPKQLSIRVHRIRGRPTLLSTNKPVISSKAHRRVACSLYITPR